MSEYMSWLAFFGWSTALYVVLMVIAGWSLAENLRDWLDLSWRIAVCEVGVMALWWVALTAVGETA